MNFLLINTTLVDQPVLTRFAAYLANKMGKQLLTTDTLPDPLDDYCDDHAIDMLFFLTDNSRRQVQHLLNASRNLRLPYIFLTPAMTDQLNQFSLKDPTADPTADPISGLHLLLPVTMLEEEVHKAQTATDILRHTNGTITLLQANDYGTHAARNTQKMLTLFQKFNLPTQTLKAQKDSFNLHKEVIYHTQPSTQSSSQLSIQSPSQFSVQSPLPTLILLTASRDYGLDDLLFGPPERKIILTSPAPTLLLNPRGDLYSLCD